MASCAHRRCSLGAVFARRIRGELELGERPGEVARHRTATIPRLLCRLTRPSPGARVGGLIDRLECPRGPVRGPLRVGDREHVGGIDRQKVDADRGCRGQRLPRTAEPRHPRDRPNFAGDHARAERGPARRPRRRRSNRAARRPRRIAPGGRATARAGSAAPPATNAIRSAAAAISSRKRSSEPAASSKSQSSSSRAWRDCIRHYDQSLPRPHRRSP